MIAAGPEIWLRAVGTALAGFSIAFAGYMLAYGDGKVRVNGMEHLAIFAQPRGAATEGAAEVAPSDATLPADMPTGSIAGREADATPVAAPTRMVAARRDRVWLMIGSALRSAGPSDEVPGVGRIGAIVQRDGGWALIDDKGATLMTLAKEANGAQLFSRSRIFE